MSQGRVMDTLRLVRDELWALFVDDGVFAGAIIVWLLVAWRVLPILGLPAWAPALLLFAGLAAILVLGALRGARKGGI